jgi:hypothetical protein
MTITTGTTTVLYASGPIGGIALAIVFFAAVIVLTALSAAKES